MLAAMTDTEKAEYEGIIRLLTVKLEEVAAENTRLRSEKSDALSVCQSIYNDPDAPLAIRIKAAGLALPHETPKLQSVPAPLELTAEPVECLADVVNRERARMDRLLALPLEERSELFSPTRRNSGNGRDEQ
jgi:hypothetical protein